MEHVSGQSHQFVEPERLEPDVGAERSDLVRLRLGKVVIASDDRHGRVLHARDGAQGAEDLDAACEWHPQIEDDCVRTMGLREDEALVGRVRRPHFEALEPKHPRKQFCDADIVVNDEDACIRGVGPWGRHWLIVVLDGRGVKLCPGGRET